MNLWWTGRSWLSSHAVAVVFDSFSDMFDMSTHGPDVWVGESADYPWGRVYGGQVAAQGLWAAAQTVESRFRPHSVHAYFIRGGDAKEPIRFEVDRIRDGRSFITRRVVARQSNGAILNLSASFQAYEDAADSTAVSMPVGVTPPEDLPKSDWGILIDRRPVERELGLARNWLKVAGPIGDDPLMHILAHTYASDDLPTEAVELAHPLGRPGFDGENQGDYPYMGASLDHSVWFHRDAPADDWTLHDMRSVGVAGARGLALGEIWTRDGTHVATMVQEALLRKARR